LTHLAVAVIASDALALLLENLIQALEKKSGQSRYIRPFAYSD
jgi:hypothetical protein